MNAARIFAVVLVFIASFCSGCGDNRPASNFRLLKSDVIGKLGGAEIVVETWNRKDSLVSMPIWRVSQRASGATNLDVLFIVESAFQESEPGFPKIVSTDGIDVIRDENASYIFSVLEREFVTNRFPSEVRVGDLR